MVYCFQFYCEKIIDCAYVICLQELDLHFVIINLLIIHDLWLSFLAMAGMVKVLR